MADQRYPLTTRPPYEASAHYQPLGQGLEIAIASLEDVIRSKTAAGRAKDLATLPQLPAALERTQ